MKFGRDKSLTTPWNASLASFTSPNSRSRSRSRPRTKTCAPHPSTDQLDASSRIGATGSGTRTESLSHSARTSHTQSCSGTLPTGLTTIRPSVQTKPDPPGSRRTSRSRRSKARMTPGVGPRRRHSQSDGPSKRTLLGEVMDEQTAIGSTIEEPYPTTSPRTVHPSRDPWSLCLKRIGNR